MLEAFGPTSDMIVAALLAIGQMITPVPEAGVQNGEKIVAARNSCKVFSESKAAYSGKSCEAMRSADRRRYKEECQGLETQVKRAEVQCASDPEVSQILRFRPHRLSEYPSLS